MANSYYSISITTTIADIKAALQDKYGSGNVTVYYESTSYLIFACAALSNKVIKTYKLNAGVSFSYGDAWSSGATITNEVVFLSSGSSGTLTTVHLVLGDNLFYMCCEADYDGVALIGKLSNNSCICVGFSAISGPSYSKGRNTTNGTDLFIGTLSDGFTDSAGKLYKQYPSFITSGGAVEENADGSLAYLSGLYNISYSAGSTSIKGANYLISRSNLYMWDAGTHLRTSIFAEW